MAKITDIKQSTNTRIRTKNQPNSISTGDVADNIDLITDEVRARGFIKSVNTAGLSAISGSNTKYALVTAIGLFEYSPGGAPNGTTIFAAEGSGTWNLVLGLPGSETEKFTIAGNYVYNLDPSMKIDDLSVKVNGVDQTGKAGFTDGGQQVLLEELTTAGSRRSISIKIYGDENPSIYLNGFTNAEVTVYKSKI
jgi:hypothetical protein